MNRQSSTNNSMNNEPEQITLDLAQARENFGSDEELLCEIANVFIEDVPQLIHELEQACERNDLVTAQRLAHSLKGLCATFGAEPARTYAQQIECDCSGNKGPSALNREQVETLVSLLERTIAALRSELRTTA